MVRGTLGATLSKPGAGWVIAGILVGTIGIALTGTAGRLKELDLEARNQRGQFSLSKGLALSLLAGVLSAVYGFALEAGEPIADVATAHGAGMWRGNVVYIFSNSGAFLTTAIYCAWLHARNGTIGEVVGHPTANQPISGAGLEPTGPPDGSLGLNWAMAILTGCLWYGQFFFYNLGHVRMGTYKFTSWAIHMIMLVLFSVVVGIALREWRESRRLTRGTVAAALAVLVGAVVLLTYGNYIGDLAAN
jgi:L-rhamnose-H+ transport protein